MIRNRSLRFLASSFTISFAIGCYLTGCDPERKTKCEWYIVPNPEANEMMEPGWVSLCVANFKLGRQRCFFTAKPDMVEKLNGVPFRYSTLKYTESIPRKILSVKTCKLEGK